MTQKRENIPVRLSHLLRHCSVGAVVRGPEHLMTIKDTREWTDRQGKIAGNRILYVDGVRSALNIVQELRKPPTAMVVEDGTVAGACIPAMRFPSWMRCPNPGCGRLFYRPWIHQQKDHPQCTACDKRPRLEELPWTLAHPRGHMTDVPWHFLAHGASRGANQRQCGADWIDSYLEIQDAGGGRRRLRCTRCGAAVVFSGTERLPYGRGRQQPWIKDAPETAGEVSEKGDDLAYVLEVNDVRVHSSVTGSALVIPPESRIRKGDVVDRLYQSSQKLQQIEQATNAVIRKSVLQTLATEFRCTIADIERAWQEIRKGYPLYGQNVTRGTLFESEYQALLQEISDLFEDEDFVTRHETINWRTMAAALPAGTRQRRIADAVGTLVAVDRLREIQVLKGFQRLGGSVVPPDIVGRSNWLPAIELYGEGIFFTLDQGVLEKWEENGRARARADEFKRRYEKSSMQFHDALQVSPRFLLLHTLSHLLIRELEREAGYPAASLKERIYCSSKEASMAGVLVYVAVPDVVGSLGGLSELAEPRRFLSLLAGVFDHAQWCSLDPVCGEHTGQGPGLLNRAACHACVLIPEPSCAYGNMLLDRTFISGDADGIAALLHV
jgi:hypothetical protein